MLYSYAYALCCIPNVLSSVISQCE